MRCARILAAFVLAAALACGPAAAAERRLILVTLDGLNWTEVFRGAEPARAADRAYVPSDQAEAVRKAFVEPADRAAALMPFLHGVVARQGVLLGDRDHGSCVAVSNDQWFSYPGYNEILTGRPDPAITSNEHGPNRNVTVLEWLNHRAGFSGHVEAVTSWTNFRDIVNAPRSGVRVNAGWDGPPGTLLAKLQAETPHIWPEVRFDAFTHAYALDALRTRKPRVLYVAYGETDDFAHDGRYDQALWAARRADGFLAEFWTALQADPAYAGKTTLIVTTDHGRGVGGPAAWKSHGKPQHSGSDATWVGILGPGVAPGRGARDGCRSTSQIAATALEALGLDWRAFDSAAGEPLAVRADQGR